jgi:hypothetical protein
MTMQRIDALDPQAATGPAKALLDGVQRKLGFVPNFMRTHAVSSGPLSVLGRRTTPASRTSRNPFFLIRFPRPFGGNRP